MEDRVTRICDIRGPLVGVTVKVAVFQLITSRSNKVDQTGMVSDGSGVARFISWRASGLTVRMIVGRSYLLRGVFVEMFNGKPSIKLSRYTQIVPIDDINLSDGYQARAGHADDARPEAREIARVIKARAAIAARAQTELSNWAVAEAEA